MTDPHLGVAHGHFIPIHHRAANDDGLAQFENVAALAQLFFRRSVLAHKKVVAVHVFRMPRAAAKPVNHFWRDTIDAPATVLTGLHFNPTEFVVLRLRSLGGIVIIVEADFGASHRLAAGIHDSSANWQGPVKAQRVAGGDLFAAVRAPVQPCVGKTVNARGELEISRCVGGKADLADSVAVCGEFFPGELVAFPDAIINRHVRHGLVAVRRDDGEAKFACGGQRNDGGVQI